MTETNGVNGISLQPHTFRVQCTTFPGETVCVSGNCIELGSWKHDTPFLLQRDINSDEPDVWSGTILLPSEIQVKYRYFVCMILDHTGPNDAYIVRRWETSLGARVVTRQELNEMGQPLTPPVEQFGLVDVRSQIESGWLTSESVIQFKVYNNPIQFWRKKYKNSTVRVKLVAINLNRQNSISEFPESDFANSMDYQDSSSGLRENEKRGWPVIEIAAMNETEHKFAHQQQFGRVYNENDMLIFQAQILHVNTTGFMIDFYVENNTDIPTHIGFCHILPSNLRDSLGSITVPITSVKQEPLGQIHVEYILMKPLSNNSCDLTVSYSRHWNHEWVGLDVGHRGSGNSSRSLKSCANIRENTIASLQKAADHGADFVEFDVQLSKDLVPVLFHDFHVNIALHQRPKKGGELTTLKIPVKDLTLKQLNELKVLHADDDPKSVQDEEIHDDDHDPFPTLRSALEKLSSHVGFNIEIKWTMQLKDGSMELENPFELNMFIDILLHTVLQHAAERRVIFSCFHPDICTMLRVKQNKYPVLFLTQGVTQRYPEYNDPRCNSISMAVYYALSTGILGLCVHTEDILRDPKQVEEVTSHGLVCFCWGDDNNCAATIKYLKELGMNGVIYDRIEDHIGNKESIFLTEKQYEILKAC